MVNKISNFSNINNIIAFENLFHSTRNINSKHDYISN